MPEDAITASQNAGDLYVRQLVLRAVRQDLREVDFVASTDTIDSYGDIVAQNWDLERFERNPVILWCHNSWDLPIGQATRCEVKGGKLECTIRFASEKANPKAELVWQGVLEKTLRAVSVGFYPREIRYERHGDKDVCVLDDNELREISVVTIPANPDALAKAKSKALADYQAKAAQTQDPQPSAERGGKPQTKESAMDPKDEEIAALKAKNADLDAQVAKLNSELTIAKSAQPVTAVLESTDFDTKLKALESQVDRLSKERDAEKAAAAAEKTAREAAEASLIEREVDALVGKKIKPSEKDLFVRLRKSDKTMFDDMIAQRSDMPHEKQVIPSEPNGAPPAPTSGPAAEASDWESVSKAAQKSN